MKKLFLGVLAVALATVACNEQQQHSAGYKVNGVAEGFNDGDTLYFYEEMDMAQPSDTIFIKDGKFALQGEVDSVNLSSIVAANGTAGAMFFREEGTIDIVLSTTAPSTVGGTKSNNGWQQVSELQTEFSVKFDSLSAPLYGGEVSEEQRQKVMADYQALQKELLAKVLDVAEQNLGNALGFFLVTSLSDSDELGAERLKDMIGRMPAGYQQRPEVKAILERLQASERTAAGKAMPDFTLDTPAGQPLGAMSEVARHKVTILDFWASWCGPCCQEMPNMVSLYAKYKDKGLGILGISLDNDKEAWTKALKDMNMTWPQVSELNGWKTAAVELFQVRAIPYMVIVDQQGTILEKGLRGPALEKFIAEKLK